MPRHKHHNSLRFSFSRQNSPPSTASPAVLFKCPQQHCTPWSQWLSFPAPPTLNHPAVQQKEAKVLHIHTPYTFQGALPSTSHASDLGITIPFRNTVRGTICTIPSLWSYHIELQVQPRSKVVLSLQGGKGHHSPQRGPVLLRVCLLELKHGNVWFQLPCCHSLK